MTPKPKKLRRPRPWGAFLEARMRALVWMRDEMGYDCIESAKQMSMDPGQVTLILAAADAAGARERRGKG